MRETFSLSFSLAQRAPKLSGGATAFLVWNYCQLHICAAKLACPFEPDFDCGLCAGERSRYEAGAADNRYNFSMVIGRLSSVSGGVINSIGAGFRDPTRLPRIKIGRHVRGLHPVHAKRISDARSIATSGRGS